MTSRSADSTTKVALVYILFGLSGFVGLLRCHFAWDRRHSDRQLPRLSGEASVERHFLKPERVADGRDSTE